MNNTFLAEAAIEGAALAYANRKHIYNAGKNIYNMAKQYFPTRQSLMADRFRFRKVRAQARSFINTLANKSGVTAVRQLQQQKRQYPTQGWSYQRSINATKARYRAKRYIKKKAYKASMISRIARAFGKSYKK